MQIETISEFDNQGVTYAIIRPRDDYKYQKGGIIKLIVNRKYSCRCIITYIHVTLLSEITDEMALMAIADKKEKAIQIIKARYQKIKNIDTQQFCFIILKRMKK